MRVGFIHGSSLQAKNEALFQVVQDVLLPQQHILVNFGCTNQEAFTYSYPEIALCIGLLINSGALDYVISGCSSGQGMNIACNTLPGF